jgi:hypothetical protein
MYVSTRAIWLPSCRLCTAAPGSSEREPTRRPLESCDARSFEAFVELLRACERLVT